MVGKLFLLRFLILISGTLFLSSCEDSEQTTLSGAQSCLDQATPSTVSACTAMVNGLTSSDAYLIRCSGHYIAQGFTTTRFVSAYNYLKTSPSGSSTNSITQSLSFMAFNDTDTTSGNGKDDSNTTLGDCSSSGVASLYRLAVLTRMATIVANVAKAAGAAYDPNQGYSPTAIQTAITSFTGNTASLGTTAIAANTAYCSTGSSYAGTSVCTTLGAAVAGGGTPTSIGTALLAQLNSTGH